MTDEQRVEAGQTRPRHHARRISHFEQEVEVLERDLLDRLPSRHGGIRHTDGAENLVDLGKSLDDRSLGRADKEEAGALGPVPHEGTVSPCHSSDRTVAATHNGEGPLEPVDKSSKQEGAVTVGPTDGPDSWADDGYLFTREGRTVWVSHNV